VLVLTRGGGSAEDLAAFGTEEVTRSVAASRIPTLVAIGHEVDISLAELAADQRASTPSNAAELLVPDRRAVLAALRTSRQTLQQAVQATVQNARQTVVLQGQSLQQAVGQILQQAQQAIGLKHRLLQAFDPQAALRRGYALIRLEGSIVRSGHQLQAGSQIAITLADADISAVTQQVSMRKE